MDQSTQLVPNEMGLNHADPGQDISFITPIYVAFSKKNKVNITDLSLNNIINWFLKSVK